ncbi:Fibronectin type III [Flavobacteriaceae bacterium]
MKFQYIIALVFLGYNLSFAQTTTVEKAIPEKESTIQVIVRVQKDKILLRWAPSDNIAWKKLNKYGYQLERYTVTRDNKTLANPEKTVLINILKPEPIENWEKVIEDNDNGAIIAQALYGESFEVEGANKLQTIVNLSEENEQRFTYALFAADKDFEMAKKAGLGFEDKTALKNEKYTYRVSSNVPIEELEIQYGGVFVGLKEYEDLPKPMDFSAHFTDKSAMLSWNFKILAHAYGSYYVERSQDKIHFERITNKPYTSMNQENENNNRIFYVDSIANNQQYNYRIQGISSFGELGPYSEIVSGSGKSILKYVPHLTIKNFKDDKTVTLTFEFDPAGDSEITGFELNRSDSDYDNKYTTVVKNIPPKSRTVTYNKLASTNYFTITAIGKQGSNRTSFPMLVQPVDSIPPAKPLNLKGVIDSLGIVKLTWDPNKEKDLMGYRIYKASNPNEEYSQMTVSPNETNKYQDSVIIKSLNSKVYYKIIAVDTHFNMSPFSEVLIVKKPDVIPPTSPIFTNYEIKDGMVSLEWINSQSEDVVSHQLYRKENEQKDWQLILDTKDKPERYQDKSITEGGTYRYAIYAKDESNLVSNPSPEIAVLVPASSVMPAIKSFYAQANTTTNTTTNSIDLSWEYKATGVESFEIYKATAEEPMQLMQMVTAQTKKISDPSITINTTYKYAIRALFSDGRVSKMTFFTLKF